MGVIPNHAMPKSRKVLRAKRYGEKQTVLFYEAVEAQACIREASPQRGVGKRRVLLTRQPAKRSGFRTRPAGLCSTSLCPLTKLLSTTFPDFLRCISDPVTPTRIGGSQT